eukprot:3026110-Rhodomonas_salina.2
MKRGFPWPLISQRTNARPYAIRRTPYARQYRGSAPHAKHHTPIHGTHRSASVDCSEKRLGTFGRTWIASRNFRRGSPITPSSPRTIPTSVAHTT